MKMLKVPGKSEVTPLKIFSTCLLGDGAEGEVSLFTVPRGYHMPQLPFDATRCVDCRKPAARLLMDADTNLTQAGQFGSAIGEAAIKRVQVHLSGGDPTSLDATVKLFVAGRKLIEAPLHTLMAGRGIGTKDGPVPILVARTDTFDVRIVVNKPARIVGGPLLVKVEFEANTVKDVPEAYEEPYVLLD